jgi:glycosyltransferase involved in cell wall biosynthesis
MQKFHCQSAERNMSNAVTFIPGLPPGDECFRAAFQAASLVLLPSRYDVSASAVAEAWAAGVPVIASPVGGGGDLIEDGVNGKLANPGNFQDFVRSCEFLLDERNRRELEKMRSDGMVRARAMRWERKLEDLMEVYNQILNK